MKVPFIDLAREHAEIRSEIYGAIEGVLESQRFILGPEVAAFESELAASEGAAHVVGVSSGTDALLVALMAVGVGPGTSVVTTPFSFFATASVILRLGATPIFADIDPDTFNLDPDAALAAVRSDTVAILPVHLYGRPATLPTTELPIVEDAAQSVGSGPVRGALACMSFFPTKNLGALGDGGAVLTNSADLAESVRLLRNQGAQPKYFHPRVGGNFRLDALQAAVLRIKLERLKERTEGRRANADRYRGLFASAGLDEQVQVPSGSPNHVYHQFVVRVRERDALREHLGTVGVSTEIYYPLGMHQQECLGELRHPEGSLPHAERAAREVLALPIFPHLRAEEQEYVVEQIAAFYRRC